MARENGDKPAPAWGFSFVFMALVLLATIPFSYMVRYGLDIGETARGLLPTLPLALALAFGAKWLFYRIWFHPRRPVRFAVLVLAANAAGLALVVAFHAILSWVHLILLAVALGEYYLYFRARKWAGLGNRFDAAKVNRAQWAIVWGNLLVAFIVHEFVFFTCLEPHPRSRVSHVKAEMRSIATAIESYIVDHDTTPVSLYRLTTPIAYLRPSRVFEDVFTPQETRKTLGFFVAGPGSTRPLDWIVWSVGPDGDRDLERYALLRFFAPNGITDEMMETLKVGYTYDPTNGAYSSGDVWRVRH